ncbi:hypothetical protein FACS189456_6570 [Bacteroidia bacterium]|nr:hypothetical protein FACS189456_6570 [Bacteroidia bacterium]
MKNIVFVSVCALLLSACSTPSNRLRNGLWRGELRIVEGKAAPFLFEVENTASDSAVLTLINGEERVPLTGICYAGDTVFIPVEAYDAVLQAQVKGGVLEGRFIRHYIEGDTGVLFTARRGAHPRFAAAKHSAKANIAGTWDVLFLSKGDTAHNVSIFSVDGQTVTGSILTNGGDLRYLEGAYTDAGVQLSAFSGRSPYLVEIDFTTDSTFEGALYTARGKTPFTGRRNPQAALADAYSLTTLKKGSSRLSFRLPNTEGTLVSLADARYKGKAVVVSILGTWCPNCLDETAYLANWYKANRSRGVEIVGLAFEGKDDFDYAKSAINRLKARYGVEYEILFAGKAGSKAAATVLPELTRLTTYPTTIFVNRQGRVVKIHTGFSGPATGAYYEAFQRKFNAEIDALLSNE